MGVDWAGLDIRQRMRKVANDPLLKAILKVLGWWERRRLQGEKFIQSWGAKASKAFPVEISHSVDATCLCLVLVLEVVNWSK
jgi:hypothetical protein